MDIYVIPDTQSKENVKNPLVPIAYHISKIKPAYIIHLGDHFDLPSLSSYDKNKRSHRVKTYLKDVRAGNGSMDEFFDILDKQWPEHEKESFKHFFMGNHEHRRDRALEYGPDELCDLMEEFPFDLTGWDYIHPFLKIKTIKGIDFCHYFQNNNSHRAITSARNILLKRHRPSVAAHQQGFDYHEELCGNRTIQAIIAGSCYFHNEEYKPQSNHHWRGTYLLYNIKNGTFDFSRFSLKALDKEFSA